MSMLLKETRFQDLIEGNASRLEKAKNNVVGRLASAIPSTGGLVPLIHTAATTAITCRFTSETAQALWNAGGRFMTATGQNLPIARDAAGKVNGIARACEHASKMGLSAGHVAASTTGAIVTVCHIVADFDNGIKLAAANVKLDELLCANAREYEAELEALYNSVCRRLTVLTQDVQNQSAYLAQLEHVSTQLDRLAIIWLKQIAELLEPINTDTNWLQLVVQARNFPCKHPWLAGTSALLGVGIVAGLLYSAPTWAAGWCSYTLWLNDMQQRLLKVESLVRLITVAVWLHHVVHQVRGGTDLYPQYEDHAKGISSAASKIHAAVQRAQALKSNVQTQQAVLSSLIKLPERLQVLLKEYPATGHLLSHSGSDVKVCTYR